MANNAAAEHGTHRPPTDGDAMPSSQPQQKRFSFYDAQEVGGILAASRSESFTMEIEEQPPNPNRFRFYDPKEVRVAEADENAPNKQRQRLRLPAQLGVGTGIGFAGGKTEPGSEPEPGDAKQQPPPRGDEAEENEAEEDGDEDGDGDGDEDEGSIDGESEPESDDDGGSNSNSNSNSSDANTDEILRSLQETEEQRNQILHPTSTRKAQAPLSPLAPSTGTNTNTSTSTSTNTNTGATTTAITGVDLAASAGVGATATATAATATATATSPGASSPGNRSLGSNTNSFAIANTNSNTNTNTYTYANSIANPYEDSLRTALDLLRKHKRSHPGSPAVNGTVHAATNTTGDPPSFLRTDGHYSGGVAQRDRTPLERDRLLRLRSYDEHDRHNHNHNDSHNDSHNHNHNHNGDERELDYVVQEAKLKSKQHKEVIARYANKLEEFKSTLSPEEHLQLKLSSSYTQSFDHDDEVDADVYGAGNGAGAGNGNGAGGVVVPIANDAIAKAIASPASQQQQQQQSPQQPTPPNHIHRHIKPSLTEDSTGLVSELSQYSNSHYYGTQRSQHSQQSQHSQLSEQQQAIIEEEVQKGVEKVLVAILEASKHKSTGSGSGSGNGSGSGSGSGSIDASSLGGGGAAGTDHGSVRSGATGSANANANGALLKVLHELLPSGLGSASMDASEGDSRDGGGGGFATATVTSRCSASAASRGSSKHNHPNNHNHISPRHHGYSHSHIHNNKPSSSVVEELLAEVDDDDQGEAVCGTISLPRPRRSKRYSKRISNSNHAGAGASTGASASSGPFSAQTPNTNAARYWVEDDEKKTTEDRGYARYDDDDDDDGEEQEQKEIVADPILSPSHHHPSRNHGPSLRIRTNLDLDINSSRDDVDDDDDDDDDTVYESETSGEDDDDDESDPGSGNSDDDDEDDEVDTTYDDPNESYERDDDDDGEHHVGVLGPLSREAGGTTGVVLDLESDNSHHSSTREKGQQQLGGFSSSVMSSNYPSAPASAAASFAASEREQQQQTLDNKRKEEILAHYDVVGTTTNIHDEEATELMRTLCAHLLPFGVDQNSVREDAIPVWDEDNANEPGYRIIRLSKTQLRRVECAFDAMITRLKHNLLNDVDEQIDANFIRELEEAERLLDNEEKRNALDITVASDASIIATKSTLGLPLPLHSAIATTEGERAKIAPHPEFPGVKSAGNGEMGDLEYFQLPIIYKSHVTGFEPTKDIKLEPGNVIAGQYLVEGKLGSAAFSTAYKCVDYSSPSGREEVCLKVIKNTKDFFDQSLDEIKILELLRQTGQCDENHILRVKTFFYYREHLIIVTELLRQNLFEFGKFIVDNDEEPYFTIPRLAYITRQCLIALRFVHNLGLVHSDVKPENILLGSYSRAQIKLIDFGSSCYLTDRQSSYIQSRSYRAPEVVLGLPYDGKIDVWSLGCVVAEMYTGEVTFQNDSIVSMLSRIEAYRGSFPRHMIAQGRQSNRFFTKSGLLYEIVGDSDDDDERKPNHRIAPAPDDEDSDNDSEEEEMEFDLFQPKITRLSSRLGFDEDLMEDYGETNTPVERQIEQMFTDFVARLLTIDPDGRPTAEEALNHPYMLYAASLTDDQIKYPSG